jgi:hypothetical protein
MFLRSLPAAGRMVFNKGVTQREPLTSASRPKSRQNGAEMIAGKEEPE